MTKDQALALIEMYADRCRSSTNPMLAADSVLTEIRQRWPEDGSENKAMRWLGFMQGALYSDGEFDLDELKEHSRLISKVPHETVRYMILGGEGA
jgi:hypothetical protein